MGDLDVLLGTLAGTVHVDLMPGPSDPSGHWLPQQPFPPCLFPLASAFSTFHRCPNPYAATVAGRHFLGTAGQPVDDLRRFTRSSRPAAAASPPAFADVVDGGGDDEEEDRRTAAAAGAAEDARAAEASGSADADRAAECVAWLAEMLAWRHLAPTAPDTLDVYPYLTNDPFVLDHSPHVFFAGNQDAFAARTVRVPGATPGSTVRAVETSQ
jgi:DNA polymerase delta subunit 2